MARMVSRASLFALNVSLLLTGCKSLGYSSVEFGESSSLNPGGSGGGGFSSSASSKSSSSASSKSSSSSSASSSSIGVQPLPTGIYALDTKGGTITNAGVDVREGNIRDYSYVAGFSWRMSWADFQRWDSVKKIYIYDFTPIDIVVPKLQVIGKKLSFMFPGAPPQMAVTTPNKNLVFTDTTGIKRPGAWDPYCLDQYRAFTLAMANHKLPDGTRFADSPVLSLIRGNICGLKAIRDGVEAPSNMSEMPGYSRAGYIDSVQQSLAALKTAFPKTALSVGMWPIGDSTRKPALWVDTLTMIQTNFPGVGLFQENLAASADTPDLSDPSRVVTGTPRPNSTGSPLARSLGVVPTYFQALQGWSGQFSNPDLGKNGYPADGMNFAFTTYQTKYFELYVDDLDTNDPNYRDGIVLWSNNLKK